MSKRLRSSSEAVEVVQLASGSCWIPDLKMSSQSDDICLIGSSRRGSHLQTSAQPRTSESKCAMAGFRWDEMAWSDDQVPICYVVKFTP